MDKSSSLGMPTHPKKYPRGTSIKAWGCLMRRGVDSFSPSSWEPLEEGMMSTAASFFLSNKPRFVNLGKSQYFRR
jgi:hypothetical protein